MRCFTLASERLVAAVGLLLVTGCGDGKAPQPPPVCETECQDAVAMRGLRETLKLAYNLTLQGKPVGDQDKTTDCPLGGNARVAGVATSNPDQGSTFVELTYTLSGCSYLQRRDAPRESYALRFDAVVRQNGVIAVQPTATTALLFESEAVTIEGAVYDPPLEYRAEGCSLKMAQSGNQLSGELCERAFGLQL